MEGQRNVFKKDLVSTFNGVGTKHPKTKRPRLQNAQLQNAPKKRQTYT